MNWRDRAKKLRDAPSCYVPEVPKATYGTFGTEQNATSKNISGTDPAKARAHLLSLAESERLPAALVHGLDAGDLGACSGCSNITLRAYLRALGKTAHMDAGQVPPTFTVATRCPECGPVWLSEPLPPAARSCPWCFRRKAGKPIPRPNHD